MLKQNLSQKQIHKLSPRQMQLMKLVQLPAMSFSQRIKEELENNPALEVDDGQNDVFDLENSPEDNLPEVEEREEAFELDDYIKDYIEEDPMSYRQMERKEDDSNDRYSLLSVHESLLEHLQKQIGLLDLKNETEELIARQIIGTIDDDGYFRREINDVIDDILFLYGLEVEHDVVEEILGKIQKLDPVGIGARDLQETLIIQLKANIAASSENLKQKELALKILEDYFEVFSKKHYKKIQKQLGISRDELKEAIDEILKLNPKPASGFALSNSVKSEYIIPDFIIENKGDELELRLNNSDVPDLHINDAYLNVLKTYKESGGKSGKSKKDKNTLMFIKQKIDSAKWFIDAIQQRQQTLYKTMYAILQFQYDYFLTGDRRRLKPMILKDIADITGLDISTISRVASAKYVQTEFGVKRLKEFFSESMVKQDGEQASTIEVKETLKNIIDSEDKQKPYSDDQLRKLLQERGFKVARRTIAKYRELMGISVGRLRKKI